MEIDRVVAPFRQWHDRLAVIAIRHRHIIIAAIILSLLGLGLTARSVWPHPARLTMIDVGQGDAIVLQTRHGQTIVIDGGNHPEYLAKLSRLVGPWDRTIDLLVLTHPHEDHASGFVELARRWKIKRVLWTDLEYPSPAYHEFQSWAHTIPADRSIIARAGQTIVIDGGMLTVRWPFQSLQGSLAQPDGEQGSGGVNDTAIVIDGILDGYTFLLMGDVSSVVEARLQEQGVLHPVDVLKVAHHGSRYSTSEGFISATKPSIALISAGAKNDFNHPAQSVIARLRDCGAQVFQTALDGTVTVEFGPKSLAIRTYR